MNASTLASAARGQNRVVLLAVSDEAEGMRNPPIFVIVLYVRDRSDKAQHWTRTELEPDVARELYDVAVAEFISAEPV